MNPFPKIESAAISAAKDIAHFAEDATHVGADVLAVLQEIKALTPAFKTELALLVQDIQPLLAALGPVVLAKGENVALDIEVVKPVLADIARLVFDFNQFLPVLKTSIAALEADVK